MVKKSGKRRPIISRFDGRLYWNHYSSGYRYSGYCCRYHYCFLCSRVKVFASKELPERGPKDGATDDTLATSEDIDAGSRDSRDVVDETVSQAQTMYNVISSTATKGFKSRFYGQRHISF